MFYPKLIGNISTVYHIIIMHLIQTGIINRVQNHIVYSRQT